jgi:hypothetical protein
VHLLGLGPKPIGARRLDVGTLTRALDDLVHRPRFALEAARVGRLLRAEPGVEAAAAAIEREAGFELAGTAALRAVAER